MPHYESYTDEDLFRVFQNDRKEKNAAFSEIYARYAHKTYMFCLRLTGHPDDAKDIFQETFIRFYRHNRESGVINNILPYLIRSARNIFLNSQRNNSRWSPFDEADNIGHIPLYEREELFNIIRSALELLELPYREAFILRFYEGFSYKEIADITGDSISALKVRVMRAKDQLREILSPYIADVSKFQ